MASDAFERCMKALNDIGRGLDECSAIIRETSLGIDRINTDLDRLKFSMIAWAASFLVIVPIAFTVAIALARQ